MRRQSEISARVTEYQVAELVREAELPVEQICRVLGYQDHTVSAVADELTSGSPERCFLNFDAETRRESLEPDVLGGGHAEAVAELPRFLASSFDPILHGLLWRLEGFEHTTKIIVGEIREVTVGDLDATDHAAGDLLEAREQCIARHR